MPKKNQTRKYSIRLNAVRVNQQINAHANLHVKQWLVEGENSVLDWAKMILHFFDDPDLILDAFKGNLIEEVFSE